MPVTKRRCLELNTELWVLTRSNMIVIVRYQLDCSSQGPFTPLKNKIICLIRSHDWAGRKQKLTAVVVQLGFLIVKVRSSIFLFILLHFVFTAIFMLLISLFSAYSVVIINIIRWTFISVSFCF